MVVVELKKKGKNWIEIIQEYLISLHYVIEEKKVMKELNWMVIEVGEVKQKVMMEEVD